MCYFIYADIDGRSSDIKANNLILAYHTDNREQAGNIFIAINISGNSDTHKKYARSLDIRGSVFDF
jgi:hypothetical protein